MKKILVASGHSDTDPGAVAGPFFEAKLALELRDLILKELPEAISDGGEGKNLPLRDSIALAKTVDLAIEIHFNAAASTFAQGVESISLPAKKEQSQKLSAAISAVLGMRLRGDSGWIDQSKSARGKLGFVEAGGIIVEVCFITNTAEMQTYQNKKQALAKVLAKLIREIA